MDSLNWIIPVIATLILGFLLVKWAILSNKAIDDLK